MEKRTKRCLLVTVVGVVLFAALMNLSSVMNFLGGIVKLILPIIAGGILAMFISVPKNGIEKLLRRIVRKKKKQPTDKTFNILSFIITAICILLVLTAVLTLIVPEIVRSSKNLYVQAETNIPKWLAYLDSQQFNVEWLDNLISNIDFDKITQGISDGIAGFISKVKNTLSSTVSVIITSVFATIISVYITLEKERVCGHARSLIRAYTKEKHSEMILQFCRAFYRSFSNFLSGQCGEAVILGMLMFLAFLIFRLPYPGLVGVLTAICAIIPYVGAFISCAVSIFLTLIIDPLLVIRCVIVYLAVQFIENQFIYPRVVGKSVGLSPLYTLIAAMIGGKLFGIIGIIFFIPLTAVIIEFVREDADRRLLEKSTSSHSISK